MKERILAEDDRPLHIEVGGGANTVARALMSIEEEYKDQDGWEELYNRICEKVILFAWGMQDDCLSELYSAELAIYAYGRCFWFYSCIWLQMGDS